MKNPWVHLTISDLRKILSEDEVEKLDTLSLQEGTTAGAINQVIDLISDTWRGAFASRGYYVDIRPHYTDPSYSWYILVMARAAVWSRFPNSFQIAIDKNREGEEELARKMLANPTIATSEPDYSDDPALSSVTPDETGGADIYVPYMRILRDVGLPPCKKKDLDTSLKDIMDQEYPLPALQ